MADDEVPDDEASNDDDQAPGDEASSDDDEAPSDERLERVQDGIDHARKTAEDADVLIDPDEPRFYESGDESDEDDQSIAPPG